MNTPGIILYPELSFLLRYTPSLSTPILQDFWAPVMPTCYPNIWRETSVERKYKEANDGEYWGCTAGVGHGNRGSRDYEECNIPEIDTSDSPDIPRRKRRGINVRTEVEVSVGRESRDQRHSRDMGMGQESGHRRDYKGYSTQMNRETGVAVGSMESKLKGEIVEQKWKIRTSLREQRSGE